jgi:hypothetical protein
MLDQTIILEVSQEEDGGFVAEGLTEFPKRMFGKY